MGILAFALNIDTLVRLIYMLTFQVVELNGRVVLLFCLQILKSRLGSSKNFKRCSHGNVVAHELAVTLIALGVEQIGQRLEFRAIHRVDVDNLVPGLSFQQSVFRL